MHHLKQFAATIGIVLSLAVASECSAAEKPQPTRTVVYKTVGDVSLALHLFEPEGHQATDKRPAIVFFFGGGWNGGTPSQFYPHCAYLASRGMVASGTVAQEREREGRPSKSRR